MVVILIISEHIRDELPNCKCKNTLKDESVFKRFTHEYGSRILSIIINQYKITYLYHILHKTINR